MLKTIIFTIIVKSIFLSRVSKIYHTLIEALSFILYTSLDIFNSHRIPVCQGARHRMEPSTQTHRFSTNISAVSLFVCVCVSIIYLYSGYFHLISFISTCLALFLWRIFSVLRFYTKYNKKSSKKKRNII